MKPSGEGLPLLFLDLDGCLHHEAVYWTPGVGAHLKAPDRYRLFQHAALLEELLAPYTEVRIVLSTSWVVECGYDETVGHLPPALQSRCIGSTYPLGASREAWSLIPRGEQVTEDAARRRPRAWFALDDDVIGWPKASISHLVQTDPYEGISPPEIQAEIRRNLARLAGP